VVVVDHGSPQRGVADVRNHVAQQLTVELGTAARRVLAASMERRPGPEYDFNDPLLENALRNPLCADGDVVVAMMFLSPGRHAGQGGDVVQICRKAEKSSPGLRVLMTPLVGDHPLIVEILADRLLELPAN
jgi:sirohydrochlorin ferrochelatase